MADVTKTAIANGIASDDLIWSPTGAPSVGDVINTAGFDVLFDHNPTFVPHPKHHLNLER